MVYLSLSREYHPDKGGSEEEFKALHQKYDLELNGGDESKASSPTLHNSSFFRRVSKYAHTLQTAQHNLTRRKQDR